MADRNRGLGVVGGGIVAGIIGGIVMAAFSMVHAAMVGVGFWTPLRLIAATTSGVDALIGGGGILIWGLMIHMMVSAMYGVILAALLPRRAGTAAGFGIGLAYGVAVWAVMTFIGLPLVNSTMQARIALMPGWWFFEHLLFGSVTGALIPVLVGRAQAAEVKTYPERRIA